MCGRFTLVAGPSEIETSFPWIEIPKQMTPRYNIAPMQPIAVIPNNGRNRLEFFQWGLVPPWAKDPQVGNRLINARAESLAEKPAFRNAFRRRRCLILADGFYEWRREPRPGSRASTPIYIRLKSGKPFAFAGLWEIWRSADGASLFSCAIITTPPNELIEEIHDRMPAVLRPEAYTMWLDPMIQTPETLSELLKPYPASEMEAYPVSTLVNNPKNDLPACILPA
ncbi:MAG: SOS response-associated peptidase [Anaerolineae bacterium]|nr:SOS response-associated peptidase [Anaerolineae bacterium]MDW8098039.1 SOS response-associated peptidase [Anaerolineae bacterium]